MTRKRTRLLSGLAAAVLISLLFAAPAPGQKDSDWRLIIARAGILIYQANSWGYVRTEVENPTDEEHELLMAVSFDAMEHNVQFTWPAWMPPRCRRTFWMPIRTPTFATPDRLLFTTKDTNGEEATETGPVRDLDQGTIPDDLRKAFAAYPKKDIALTPGATCQVLKEGASWLISDGYGGYAVVKERNELKIYLQVPGVDIKAQLLETVDGEHQKVESIGLLMVEPKRPTTAILNSRDPDASAKTSYAVEAMRRGSNLIPRMTSLVNQELPPLFVGWQAQDCVVIARPKPQLDAAQLDALRQWVLAGGRLWIMVDQVEPAFAARLLRNDWTCRVVDYVELNAFTVAGGSDKGRPLEFEQPVRMARLFAPGWQVIHRVQGWPASLRRDIGLGSVLVTTIGPRAWHEMTVIPHFRTGHPTKTPVPLGPLNDLTRNFNRAVEKPPLPADLLAEFAARQIGHSIIARRPVAWVLGGLCILVVLTAAVMAWQRRLEHTAWVTAVLAIAAALALWAMGNARQSKTPLTIAEAQIAQVLPGQQHAVVSGVLAIYSPVPDKGPLQASKGGVVWPTLANQASELLRMKWRDFDKWIWDGLTLPKGKVITARFRQVLKFKEPVEVTMRFDAGGATGSYQSSRFENFEHVVLATPDGCLAPRIAGDGTFRITKESQLPRGQYLAGQTLSTMENHRQKLYRTLFDPRRAEVRTRSNERLEGNLVAQDAKSVTLLINDVRKTIDRSQIAQFKTRRARKIYPDRPMWFAWTKALQLGFTLPKKQDYESKRTTLAVVPVRIDPTPPGEKVFVPAAFIHCAVVRDVTGKGTSSIYDAPKQEWLPVTQGMEVILKFSLPPQVAPLHIEGGRWTIDIDAPGRSVETFVVENEQLVEIDHDRSGFNTRVVELADQSGRIQPDDGGTILLALKVGEASDRSAPSQWQIQSVRLEVEGRVGGGE